MENCFANVHPELVAEWSERNFPLTPEDITYGSKKLVWWKSDCGHEWTASPKSRSAGEKCPICSGKRVIAGINDLATLEPILAAEWSEKNGVLKPTMVAVHSHKKVVWRGFCGHEWVASVKSRTYGSGCPYCSHNLTLEGFNDLASVFPEIASEWSEQNLPLLPNMVTAYANKKVWWKCEKGHEWQAFISTRSYGSKCPYCSGLMLLPGFNDLATTNPELSSEWSKINGSLNPQMVNEKCRKNVWWECKICGHEWRSVVYSRVKGRTCPVCADRTVMAGRNDLATTDKHLLLEWDFERNGTLLPTAISRNSMRSTWWKCPVGHFYKEKVYNKAVEKCGCKICEKEFKAVFPALAVSYYASKYGIHTSFNSDDMIGIPLEIYLNGQRLAIETSKNNDDVEYLKAYLCKKRGIDLIKMPYSPADDEIEVLRRIKFVFRRIHTWIDSNESEDIFLIRKRFYELQQNRKKESL